ncbi:response regulator [Paenibacillus algorifonticola]|uniref:response regulator transcription factor n=1 Tax=Paenibacillus algorifonticola TaxID=684063 RepID=UPI003D2B916A
MIKAIVVDDERLVRKGFISLFDWSMFGISIVGEAGDGKAALELLTHTEVDLVFTDITMPQLSGFELIEQIKQRFPTIRSVVLTCHHEFDYVQEALRLGAIDYIVKTLLEPDKADEVMQRIVQRFRWENSFRAGAELSAAAERMKADAALVCYPLEEGAGKDELCRLPVLKNFTLLELKGLWLIPLPHLTPESEWQRELAQLLKGRFHYAIVTGLQEKELADVKRLLEERFATVMFYKSSGQHDSIQMSFGELQQLTASTDQEGQLLLLDADMADLRWALYPAAWETLICRLEQLRASKEQLMLFGQNLLQSWSALLMQPSEAEGLRAELIRSRCWQDYKSWLRRFSDYAQRRMLALSLSKEVFHCMLRATVYIRREAAGKLNQVDVADYVKMSRSYFSGCFARFAGMPFGVMLRGIRMERAKELLLTTEMPVYEIACSVGFEDDKYFSKLFRELVGSLPSEFRAERVRIGGY